MQCWFCGEELIWQNDYDAKEYFMDEDKEGVVATLLCSGESCNASYEAVLLEGGMNR